MEVNDVKPRFLGMGNEVFIWMQYENLPKTIYYVIIIIEFHLLEVYSNVEGFNC